MLSSISGLLGPLTQTFSSRLIEKHSRKKILLKSVFLESLIWLPLILISFLFYKGIVTEILPLFLLLTFSLFTILANIGSPAWFSWMGDIVDKKYRGRWFSKRSLITGFIIIILSISASFLLDYFKKNGWTMFGFIILFSLAFIARIICWKIYKKQYEPKIKLKKGYYFSFWNFIMNAPKNNFGKFAIFRFFLSFATSISAPLLAIYLLRNLNFSYPLYMIVISASAIYTLIVLKLWGKFADKYGNYKVLALTTIFIPIVPILWVLHPSPIYMIFIPALISGIFWAGFNLSTGNFIYDNISKQKRGVAVSYYNMLNGIGIFLGAGLGALLIKFLTFSFIEPIIFIFLFGGFMRMIAVFWWLPKFKEIRRTKKFKGSKTIKNIIFKEAKPALIEEVHEIISIKDYLRE
jgi:MFS family permease